MRHHFETESWVPYPVDQVFGLFANPENLPRIMPAWQKTHIESAKLVPPPSEQMPHIAQTVAGAGSELYVTFRPLPLLPLRIGWRVLISEFVYLSHFCDTQLSGPFQYWHHCHRMRQETRDGAEGTALRDEVEYELPLALLSDLATGLTQVNLAGIFRYRHKEALKLLAAGTPG